MAAGRSCPTSPRPHFDGRASNTQPANTRSTPAKTLDPAQRQKIAQAPTPREAKLLGRSVQLRPEWDKRVRFEVMKNVLYAKFACHPTRIEALLSTGLAVLQEGNTWHDQTWGDCFCGRAACEEPGANYLGLMLMELRDELRGTR